ncbi:MAG: glucose-1-phosphate adenylyltransferase [Chloroflexi bacterium HGW-Chloroflexi-10]|nr:MAG: glucose-1-phosphate adenylyltransferase [Chloroflexi bacterium HGW-Chloroflexi-10]
MKTRAVILAGGEGTRLQVLTAKRAKPAVLFAGKYRVIDFTLSNCVNSQISDVMILAQYRPQSLIEHIGSGGPWDLNLDFTGGVRILTPYKAKASDWFVGTADAVQQNFTFIKRGNPDHILILSGDHIYAMDYRGMSRFHQEKKADVTIACIQVPMDEASRYGILEFDENRRITKFVEKPENPPCNTANMGVYLFNREVLNQALWEDHFRTDSNHDFGKDIIPKLIAGNLNVFAYPFEGYWVDVGTIETYWKAQMDLLKNPPSFKLYHPSWIIHTRTEERPPAQIHAGAIIENCLISDGCVIESGAVVQDCICSPGVWIKNGAIVKGSILFTDCIVHENAQLTRCIADKRVIFHQNTICGDLTEELQITLFGRESIIPPGMRIEPGAMIGTDVIESDFKSELVKSGEIILTRRLPYEI